MSKQKQKQREQRRRRRRPVVNTEGRKLSQLILEFAGDFIQMGDTQEHRESLLNAACSAWNIANSSADKREYQIDEYTQAYIKCNRHADDEEKAGVRHNLETLIKKKQQMFPNDHRHILGAHIVSTTAGERVEVASARFD